MTASQTNFEALPPEKSKSRFKAAVLSDMQCLMWNHLYTRLGKVWLRDQGLCPDDEDAPDYPQSAFVETLAVTKKIVSEGLKKGGHLDLFNLGKILELAGNVEEDFRKLKEILTNIKRKRFVGYRAVVWEIMGAEERTDGYALAIALAEEELFEVKMKAVRDAEGLATSKRKNFDKMTKAWNQATTDHNKYKLRSEANWAWNNEVKTLNESEWIDFIWDLAREAFAAYESALRGYQYDEGEQ